MMADSRNSKAGSKNGGTVIIKKYANRRLYNTQTSSYITLDFLANLVRENVDFKVVDAKSGEDITHNILTQIIMDEESSGQQMLPVGFLRELISMYGNSMQNMIPQYLEASMAAFRTNQEKFHKAVQGSLTEGPLAQLAKQNFAMVEAATQVFRPRATAEKTESTGEVDDLKAQIAAMQQKLDDIAAKK